MQGDHDRGTALLEEALVAAQGVADRRLAGILAGRVSINLARSPAGPRSSTRWPPTHLEEALRLVREAGYTEGMILALGDLGNLARDRATTRGRWRCIEKRWIWAGDHPGRAWSPK